MAETMDQATDFNLVFDGQDDRVELGKKPEFKIQRDMTLEAWIYPQQRQSKWTGIFSCIYDTGATESGYGLLLDGKTGIQFGLALSSSNRILYLSSKAHSIRFNAWQHIAATFDGEQMQVYVNGVLKATKSASSAGICYKPENDLLIGMYRDNNQTYPFMGMIAEVRLWNLVRSPADLLSNHQQRLRGDEPGLVGYWPLNEGTGTTLHDKTNYLNAGVLLGQPRWQPSSLPFDFATSPQPIEQPIEQPIAQPIEQSIENAMPIPSGVGPAEPVPRSEQIPSRESRDHPISDPDRQLTPVANLVLEEDPKPMSKTKAESNPTAPAAPKLYSRQAVLTLGAHHPGITAGTGAIKPQKRFTIEVWICPSKLTGVQVIFADGEAVFYLEDGELKFRSNAEVEPITSVNAGLKAGTWYHVAVARGRRLPGYTKLYINGVQNDNQAAMPAIASLGNNAIGGYLDAEEGSFQGKLLELRIWRYLRSQTEIQENMVFFLTGRELGLARCWAMDEGFGMTITGKTTTRAVGTIVGDATWEEVEIPLKVNLNAKERLTRSTGLEDYAYWYAEMAKQQKTEADPPFRRGRIWA